MTTGVFGGTTPKRVALPVLAGTAMVLNVGALAFSFDLTRRDRELRHGGFCVGG
jgi:hypothetical protein